MSIQKAITSALGQRVIGKFARKEEYERISKQMKEKDSTIYSHSKSELQLTIAQANKEDQNLKRNEHIQKLKNKRGIR